MTMTFDYRNHDATVAHRLQLRRRLVQEELSSPGARRARRVLRRRIARSCAAIGGVLALAGTLVNAVVGADMTRELYTNTAELFFLSWLAIPFAYALGWLIAPIVERRALRRALAAHEAPILALDALRDATGASIAARVASRWEVASLTLPLLAIAVLGPLTIHAPFFLNSLRPGHAFGQWVLMSVVIVGHAHLALAYFAHRYVQKLSRGEAMGSSPALRAWLKTILVAATPGILLAGIPPVLTAITGAVLVGPMFYWAREKMKSERRLLE